MVMTDVLISEDLLEKLNEVIPVEDNKNRVSFAIALALLMTGDLKMSEVKSLTGISELHFDSLMSNIDLPENDFISRAKEYIDDIIEKSSELEKGHVSLPSEKTTSEVKSCKAFELRDGLVHITAKSPDLWFAIKQTIKEHDGKFIREEKAWKLSDDNLKKWLEIERKYGWELS